ncbi:MAG: hypothetical protein WCP79_06415 [Bacillota bacterium]
MKNVKIVQPTARHDWPVYKTIQILTIEKYLELEPDSEKRKYIFKQLDCSPKTKILVVDKESRKMVYDISNAETIPAESFAQIPLPESVEERHHNILCWVKTYGLPHEFPERETFAQPHGVNNPFNDLCRIETSLMTLTNATDSPSCVSPFSKYSIMLIETIEAMIKTLREPFVAFQKIEAAGIFGFTTPAGRKALVSINHPECDTDTLELFIKRAADKKMNLLDEANNRIIRLSQRYFERIHISLAYNDKLGTFQPDHFLPNLWFAMWYRLYYILTKPQHYRKCAYIHCSKYFYVDRPASKAKYCPRPDGETTIKSACAKAADNQDYRNSKRDKKQKVLSEKVLTPPHV